MAIKLQILKRCWA